MEDYPLLANNPPGTGNHTIISKGLSVGLAETTKICVLHNYHCGFIHQFDIRHVPEQPG